MPTAHNPTHKDGRVIAESNDLRVLKAIRLFGHLRRQEIAMAAWPNSPAKSAYIMSCRTTSRLVKAAMLLERPNILGGHSLILGAKGVNRLKDADLVSQEGYELAFDGPQFFHRTVGTCYLLEKAKAGSEVFGEYSLIKGWAPVKKDFVRETFKKIPDGLIVYSREYLGLRHGMRAADWVEVESAYKPYDELRKALSILRKQSSLNKNDSLTLNKLVFVYDSRQNHEKHILRAVTQFLKEYPELGRTEILETIVLAKCFIDPPFVWHGVLEKSAGELLGEPLYKDLSSEPYPEPLDL